MDPLSVWTIYKDALDHPPGTYTVRRWQISREDHGGCPVPMECLPGFKTLEEARGKIPFGLHNIHRSMSDDPCIVETWI